MNRRHMTGDHHGQTAGRATLLARAMDEILGTHSTEKWPVSPHTPDSVAAQLARSRQMFVDGYYTYENFFDAATRSLQAVEAALRVRLEAGSKTSFAQLIDTAKKEGLIDDYAQDILHTGRRLRNDQIHATATAVFNPAIAASVIATSHKLVAELFAGVNSGLRPARRVQPAHQVTGQAEQLEGLVVVHLAELLVGGRVADRLL